jgi:hypothetical protein
MDGKCAEERLGVLLIRLLSTGEITWAVGERQPLSDMVKDVLAIQDEIAESVGAALRLGSTPEASFGTRFHTQNPQAYDLYLKGRQLFHQFRRNGFQRARNVSSCDRR